MKRFFWIGFIAFALWKFTEGSGTVELGPGVKVIEAPTQETISQPQVFEFKGYKITPLADFSLKAKVLSKENYRLGRESDLSPIDLTLGWGSMSDESVLQHIDISQSGRWYYWRVEQFPIPRKAIETQSANMHMIPANSVVEKQLAKTKQGQIISLNGYLIRADASDGWHWQSSLTRNDTGNHACEIIYVESFEILTP